MSYAEETHGSEQEPEQATLSLEGIAIPVANGRHVFGDLVDLEVSWMLHPDGSIDWMVVDGFIGTAPSPSVDLPRGHWLRVEIERHLSRLKLI